MCDLDLRAGTLARLWGGTVPAMHAEGFRKHLQATGIAEAQATTGWLGAVMLCNDEAAAGRARFVLLTFWSDATAVRRFAGPDPNVAVLYPGDEAFGLDPDLTVAHYHVCSISGLTT